MNSKCYKKLDFNKQLVLKTQNIRSLELYINIINETLLDFPLIEKFFLDGNKVMALLSPKVLKDDSQKEPILQLCGLSLNNKINKNILKPYLDFLKSEFSYFDNKIVVEVNILKIIKKIYLPKLTVHKSFEEPDHKWIEEVKIKVTDITSKSPSINIEFQCQESLIKVNMNSLKRLHIVLTQEKFIEKAMKELKEIYNEDLCEVEMMDQNIELSDKMKTYAFGDEKFENEIETIPYFNISEELFYIPNSNNYENSLLKASLSSRPNKVMDKHKVTEKFRGILFDRINPFYFKDSPKIYLVPLFKRLASIVAVGDILTNFNTQVASNNKMVAIVIEKEKEED